MKKIFKTASLVGTLVAGSILATQASAATVDFTSNIWNTGAQSIGITTGGVNVNVSSLPSTTTTLQWTAQDGFGVTGPSDSDDYDDEIDRFDGDMTNEQIRIAFGSAVTLNNFTVADFFLGTGLGGSNEVGQVSINGGAFQNFTSTVAQAGDNQQLISIGGAGVTSLVFQAGDGASDFAIAGLDITASPAPVPLPPAVWLLGSAMVFLFRKRQTS